MICKNCANIFSDDLDVCPECGTPLKKNAAENVQTDSSEGIEKLVSLAFSMDVNESASAQKFEDVFSYSEEQFAEIENSGSEELSEEKETESEDAEIAMSDTAFEIKAEDESEESEVEVNAEPVVQVRPATEKAKLPKMTAKEKGSFNFILSLMAVIFIIILALAGVRMGTDIFDKDEDSVKAIVLSGLTSAETADLEEYLSKIALVAYSGFDREKHVAVDVMNYFRPHDAGGLYNRFFSYAEITANTPDPAGRFKNENGDYSYYVLDADKVDSIIEKFGYSVNSNINEKNFYRYDDKYYFANLSDYTFSADVVADISLSKRIQDGSYYVECSFYDESAADTNKNYFKAYIILDKYEDAESSEVKWIINRISDEAIFDSSGLMIKDESGLNELSYTIETKTLEAVTEDGEVYARYILEYPVFSGDTKGEKVVNYTFEDMVKTYSTDVQSATEAYNKFIKKVGKAEELPYVTYVTARVSYNRNGYISIILGTSEKKPQSSYKASDAQEGEFQPVFLPEKKIQGYTIEVGTGEFIPKKEMFNVEYTLVHELLYRIYNGYEYESLINENIVSEEIIPEDTENTGMAFYESACGLSRDGLLFCYVSPEGYTENIVIPYDTEGFFSEDFGKRAVSAAE